MLPYFSIYLHAKNQQYQCIPSRDFDNSGILKSDWTIAFWSITCKAEFCQKRGLHKKTENWKIIHFRFLPVKSDDKMLPRLIKIKVSGIFKINIYPPVLSIYSYMGNNKYGEWFYVKTYYIAPQNSSHFEHATTHHSTKIHFRATKMKKMTSFF